MILQGSVIWQGKPSKRSPASPSPSNQGSVQNCVPEERSCAQGNLRLPRKRGRIEDRNQVVLDEIPSISRRAASLPEPVLERSQRASASRKLDGDGPDDRRDMEVQDPSPAKGGESPQNHESNESEMSENHEVREKAKEHGSGMI